ncbi:sugar porter family MFS transporter (plasmid) [Streptomyces sp. CA-142005]|uniref:sugar porter family MFS transporter n=1 Tax=Streptomyces sp. CA-142005 TaxID=3240052 RepID=UPI003D8A7603
MKGQASAARSDGVPALRARLALMAAFSGAFFGFSISAMNQILDQVHREFGLTNLHEGIVVSVMHVGALVGCACASAFTDRLGRRRMLIGAGLLGAAAAPICATAPDASVLVTGRLLLGLAVGITSAIAPLLLAELAGARSRGALITAYQLCLTVGILAALALGATDLANRDWRLMFAANGAPAILQAVAVAFVPPAAGDLLARGRPGQALRVLQLTRGPDEAAEELAELRATRRRHSAGIVKTALSPDHRLPVAIAVGAALMNALVGVGAVIYYSSLVFASAGVGGHNGPEVASLTIGIMNVVASVFALVLIKRYARRTLLGAGLVGMAAALCVTASGLMAGGLLSGGLTVAAVLAYIACFAFSAGPLAWVLMAEVLPTEIRAPVAGVALALNWAANMLVALVFPVVTGTPASPVRVGAVFLCFAALSLVFLMLLRRFVPETKDRPLAEVQALLRQS